MKTSANPKLEQWLDFFFESFDDDGADNSFEAVADRCDCTVEDIEAAIKARLEAIDRGDGEAFKTVAQLVQTRFKTAVRKLFG